MEKGPCRAEPCGNTCRGRVAGHHLEGVGGMPPRQSGRTRGAIGPFTFAPGPTLRVRGSGASTTRDIADTLFPTKPIREKVLTAPLPVNPVPDCHHSTNARAISKSLVLTTARTPPLPLCHQRGSCRGLRPRLLPCVHHTFLLKVPGHPFARASLLLVSLAVGCGVVNRSNSSLLQASRAEEASTQRRTSCCVTASAKPISQCAGSLPSSVPLSCHPLFHPTPRRAGPEFSP
jgi:hypothetical protein